jgi:hypothetical protein
LHSEPGSVLHRSAIADQIREISFHNCCEVLGLVPTSAIEF